MSWTPEEISKLRTLAFEEKPNAEIAATLHKTLSDVYAKRSELGITIPKVEAAKGKEPAPAVTQQGSLIAARVHDTMSSATSPEERRQLAQHVKMEAFVRLVFGEITKPDADAVIDAVNKEVEQANAE